MVKLIIEDDEGKTTVVPLIRDEITIGRKEGNTIRLTERNISRRHAKLLRQNGAIFSEDLNSYNGIKVNGNRIAGRIAIAEGDRIQIGDYVLGLKMEGQIEVREKPSTGLITLEIPRSDEAVTTPIDTAEEKATIEIVTKSALELEAPPKEPEADVKPEHRAYLVCVSTNFPGQEWELNRPLMVLGRTEDNDIVVNHRSISRHHARITENLGRYTIVDLHSSNGVRVNGEEYGKVELRRGDLIDLGHVRLRFIAPGEDFVFSRDASVVDISKAGSSRGRMWAALSVGVVLLLGFFIWRLSSQEETSIHTGESPTLDPAKPAMSEHHLNTEKTAGANWLNQIRKALSSEQWAAALGYCAQLSKENRNQAQAECEQAMMEKKALDDFETAHSAYLQRRYIDVMQYFKRIPEKSTYKKRDLQIFTAAKHAYLDQVNKNLEKLVQQSECEKAKSLAAEIKEAVPEDTEAEQSAKDCKPAKVAHQEPNLQLKKVHVRPPRLPKKLPPKKLVPIVELQHPDVVDLNQANQVLQQGRDAYVEGKYLRAIELARQVLKITPQNKMAIQILGASACYLKNRQNAEWAFDRLAPQARNSLKTICGRNGLNLE